MAEKTVKKSAPKAAKAPKAKKAKEVKDTQRIPAHRLTVSDTIVLEGQKIAVKNVQIVINDDLFVLPPDVRVVVAKRA